MIKRETGFTPLERSSYHLNGIRKYIARMWLKSQPNFQTGFTLVELLVAMVMFVFVIAAASTVFTSLLTQFKQQSKIAETNIEGIIGLELLRQDIEHAGYGLPWVIPGGIVYLEADDYVPTVLPQDETQYNDSPSNPPRAFVSGNGQGTNGSDVLVVKAINVARNPASQKWTHLSPGNTVKEWDPTGQRLQTSDRVIVLGPQATRPLVVSSGGSFTTTYRADTDPDSVIEPVAGDFASLDPIETRIVYGVTNPASPVTTLLRMPFNRADYYVRIPATNFPSRCATGTGVFYKATVNQGDGVTAGGGLSELPLIDCVADFQVVYRQDTTGDGNIDTTTDDISALTAQNIRTQVKEVRVYVLAHEGQRDPNFTFTNFTPGACATCIRVGETGIGGYNDFDFTADFTTPNPDWEDYRWKVYTLVVKPNNLE